MFWVASILWTLLILITSIFILTVVGFGHGLGKAFGYPSPIPNEWKIAFFGLLWWAGGIALLSYFYLGL